MICEGNAPSIKRNTGLDLLWCLGEINGLIFNLTDFYVAAFSMKIPCADEITKSMKQSHS
jgi:hypothetical protein